MNFYYNGKKAPSKGYDVASGCLLLIGLGALVFLFTLIDDIEDLEGHWFQLIFVILMVGSILFSVFRKKAKLHTYKIEITDEFLKMNTVKAKVNEIQLDIYARENSFDRYHLWDKSGKLALFSTLEDDFSKYFQSTYPNQVFLHEIINNPSDGPDITVKAKEQTLNYHLDIGSYSINTNGKIISEHIPEVYAYDGRYKIGKGLLKKK
tara:strand:+ start:6242 stop:6862 length:621 start_codon:yes stop_codon:yes gene_type:complete